VHTVKKAVNILSSAVLITFVLLAILLVGVRVIGFDPHIVLSGSMEPEIMTGSLVYVDRISREEACELEVGDTVTFLLDERGTKVTHKIYEVVGPLYVKNQYGELVLDENGEPTVATDDEGYPIIIYTTYGINNKNDGTSSGYTLDGTEGVGNLASSNVIGKPKLSVPLLGYVAHFLQKPTTKYVTIIVCVLLLCNALFGDSFKKPKQDTEESAEDSDSGNNAEPTPIPPSEGESEEKQE
jgi:signal peptidase I